MEVLVVGAGVGGLTLALCLARAGIACRVFEATHEFRPIGAGVNLLPHAVRELDGLGLLPALLEVGVETKELCFFNQHGQHIYFEPRGRYAGYEWPQISLHRGELHHLLLREVGLRIGRDRVHMGHRCVRVEQDESGVIAYFADGETNDALPPRRGTTAIGCDGIHSAIRRQLYPTEGPPLYSGVTMWRGTVRHQPFLSGASMILAGNMRTGKLVAYPIGNEVGADGLQWINWVAEVRTPARSDRSWTRPGQLSDIVDLYREWAFDWLDVPALLQGTDTILECPMVDQDPLERWSHGRLTLLGDAAHPMYPVGSNGAGQAIIDAGVLVASLARGGSAEEALTAYERERIGPTRDIVLLNRTSPPDAILDEVDTRTSGQPFDDICDVISREELAFISQRYKRTTGFSRAQVNAPPAPNRATSETAELQINKNGADA